MATDQQRTDARVLRVAWYLPPGGKRRVRVDVLWQDDRHVKVRPRSRVTWLPRGWLVAGPDR